VLYFVNRRGTDRQRTDGIIQRGMVNAANAISGRDACPTAPTFVDAVAPTTSSCHVNLLF
jgi:hypothetical protein